MSKHNNEKGFTLVVVLMVLVVLSVFTVTVIGIATNHSVITHGEQDDQATFYIAEAGINSVVAKIDVIAEEAAAIAKGSYPDLPAELRKEKVHELFKEKLESKMVKLNTDLKKKTNNGLSFEKNNSEVHIQLLKKTDFQYEIISTGTIGKKKRKLERSVTISLEGFKISNVPDGNPESNNNSGGTNPVVNVPEGTAVFVNGQITMTEGAKINGNIGTNKSGSKTIALSGGASVTGNVFVPAGSESEAVSTTPGITVAQPTGLDEKAKMELPEFPKFEDYPYPKDQIIKSNSNQYEVIRDGDLRVDNWISADYVLKVSDNMSFHEIKLGSNYSMTIDVGNTDKVIVVDHLNLENGHIKIIGTGKLTFVVKNQITMGSGSTINNGGSLDQLGVYLEKSTDPKKPKEVKLAGSQKIFGSLYAEDANIHITGGGGFQGNILTGGKKVTINGGGSAYSSLILAPNADVLLAGGGNVKGAIYANTLYADGGTIVQYKKPTIETGPFTPTPENPEPSDPILDTSAVKSHLKLGTLTEN